MAYPLNDFVRPEPKFPNASALTNSGFTHKWGGRLLFARNYQ